MLASERCLRKCTARCSQPVCMTRGAGGWNGFLPFGFEQSVIRQAYEERIKRPGLQVRFTHKIVTVTPDLGTVM